jgi:heme oxygenase
MSGRERLRAATNEIHERLHGLPPFVDLLAGRLSRTDYRDLLGCLWGFHAVLDAHLADGAAARRDRVARLKQDLHDLGLSEADIDALPTASFDELPSSGPKALGAAYVQEGSMLGGTIMARALDPLLGVGCLAGRRFLTPGPKAAAQWRACLDAVEATAVDSAALDDMIEGAVATFAIFERHVARAGDEPGGRVVRQGRCATD